jgi:hypothetical protein
MDAYFLLHRVAGHTPATPYMRRVTKRMGLDNVNWGTVQYITWTVARRRTHTLILNHGAGFERPRQRLRQYRWQCKDVDTYCRQIGTRNTVAAECAHLAHTYSFRESVDLQKPLAWTDQILIINEQRLHVSKSVGWVKRMRTHTKTVARRTLAYVRNNVLQRLFCRVDKEIRNIEIPSHFDASNLPAHLHIVFAIMLRFSSHHKRRSHCTIRT